METSESNHKKYKTTYLINLIGSPSCGKTTMAALIFGEMKLLGESIEYVQEYVKKLVWLKEFDKMNNQHSVSTHQYRLFKEIEGHVEFIITDGALLNGLYYNRNNPDNVSDVKKTEDAITKYHSEFHNINIFVNRGNFPYEQAGRIQTEAEAKEVEKELKNILKELDVKFVEFNSGKETVNQIIAYIKSVSGY